MMKHVPAPVEPAVDDHRGLGEAQPRLRGGELDCLSLNRDGVVVVYLCLVSPAEDVPYVGVCRKWSPCGFRIFRGNAEQSRILGDEDLVQILGCLLASGDLLHPQFGDKPVLEGPVDPLTSSPCLGRVSKDKAYPELAHGPLELGRLHRIALQSGGLELGGSVEVEGRGAAETGEDLLAYLEAALRKSPYRGFPVESSVARRSVDLSWPNHW